MAMICMDCGNKDEFRQQIRGNKAIEGVRYLDGNEETTDEQIETEEDVEWDDEGQYECDECGDTDIEADLSDRDLQDIEWKHRDKDGTWNAEELDEEDRDEELGDSLLVKDV